MATSRAAMSQGAYNDLVDACHGRGWSIGLSVLNDPTPGVQISIWASPSRRYFVATPAGDRELDETLDQAAAHMLALLAEDCR